MIQFSDSTFFVKKNREPHPVRRVRDILRNTPEEFQLQQFGTAEGFAELMECSTSWIRNVECRATENWVSLAKKIEKKTNISADWLLGNPPPDEPVMDRSGSVWNPIEQLDPLAASDGMPNWRKLHQDAPSVIPDLVSDDLRVMLIWELSIGCDETLSSVIAICKQLRSYKFSAVSAMRKSHEQMIGKAFASRVFVNRKGAKVLAGDLESRLKVNLLQLSTDDAARILEDQGVGWIRRLDKLPQTGPIIEMMKLHLISREDAEY